MLNNETGVKTLTVEQLIECIAGGLEAHQVNRHSLLAVNEVGNLLILSDDQQEPLGYIDFLFDGDITWFDKK